MLKLSIHAANPADSQFLDFLKSFLYNIKSGGTPMATQQCPINFKQMIKILFLFQL
jgi:hypothetical protein